MALLADHDEAFRKALALPPEQLRRMSAEIDRAIHQHLSYGELSNRLGQYIAGRETLRQA